VTTATGTDAVLLIDGVRQTVLDSGVRVVTETMPDVRSVTVGMWVGVGSRDEDERVAGASHFLEHLLFKGTGRRSALQIAEVIDAVGGDLNAFTTKEYTCFYAQTLDRDLALAADVLGDLITSATIRAEDVDAERDVVLEEIRMHLDTPDDLVHSAFSAALWSQHPLGREVLGSAASIGAMPRDAVHGYYAHHYVAENLVVVAAGNVLHDEVVTVVSAALEGIRSSGVTTLGREAPNGLVAPHVVVRPRPTEQSHVVLGGLGLARNDPRRFAASVLNQALGGGMASRLFQEVRERRGLAYSVYSYQGMHADTGTFAVYAGTTPAKVRTVLDVLRAELDGARGDGLGDAELQRARGHLAGSIVLALEDTGSRMMRLGKAVTTGTELLTLDQTIAAIEAVDHDAVQEVADAVLAGPFTLAVVGPHDGETEADYAAYTAA
jgi:predicted Zn-dependent peptidase